jgi:nucleotide-binding universal stress UspA family protein
MLVGIDGSQQSIKAAYQALDIANQNNSEIIALYVSLKPFCLEQISGVLKYFISFQM